MNFSATFHVGDLTPYIKDKIKVMKIWGQILQKGEDDVE